MKELIPVLTFIAGSLFGFGIAVFFGRKMKQSKEKEVSEMTESIKGVFAQLSNESLHKNTESFLQLAESKLAGKTKEGEKELENKKALIDSQLANMKDELLRIQKLMNSMEKERESRFSEISEQIKNTVYQTEKLTEVTGSLNRALSSSAERGRWGERMALDIIRAIGMKEKINYDIQKTMKNGSRPDFTFYLPNNYCVNMDVKFPLDSFLKYCSEETGGDEQHLKNFLRDVRQKIKEVKNRGYIDTQENTLDVMLLFIPNESVYEFINEKDPEILDLALSNNVVFTSPLSFFAVLSVIRQSVENFAFENTSGEMLKYFGEFYKQWSKFVEKLENIGKKLDEAQKNYDELISTRKNMLEKPLDKIEGLRREKGIVISED